jgi:hypothetical protein
MELAHATSLPKQWHDERKARLARFKAAALKVVDPERPAPSAPSLPPIDAPIACFPVVPVLSQPGAKWWADMIEPESAPSLAGVIRIVCAYFQVGREALTGKARTKDVLGPRQLAMYLCRVYVPDASFPKIGLLFDRDHTTVLHAVQVMPYKLKADKRLRDAFEAIVKTLGERAVPVNTRARPEMWAPVRDDLAEGR